MRSGTLDVSAMRFKKQAANQVQSFVEKSTAGGGTVAGTPATPATPAASSVTRGANRFAG
jgi:hypothetical protein